MEREIEQLAETLSSIESIKNIKTLSRQISAIVVGVIKSSKGTNTVSSAVGVVHDIIRRAVSLLPSNQLTIIHRDWLKMCLEFGLFDEAYTVACTVWTSIEGSMGSLALLEYHYYAALSQLHERDYVGARMSLLSVLAVPSPNASVVHVAALRKLCLVDLVVGGSLRPLPAWVAHRLPSANRLWDDLLRSTTEPSSASLDAISPEKSLSRANRALDNHRTFREANPTAVLPADLTKLVSFFKQGCAPLRTAELEEVLKVLARQLEQSKDWGLAKRLLLARKRHALERIARVYTVITVEKCMSEVEAGTLDELNAIAHELNNFNPRKSISCRVDSSSGYVEFYPVAVKDTYVTVTNSADLLLSAFDALGAKARSEDTMIA